MSELAEIQAILDSVDAPTIIFCQDQFRLANRAALIWAETPGGELDKLQLWDWIHPNSRRTALSVYRYLQHGEPPQEAIKLCLIHPRRDSVWVEVTLQPASYLSPNCWIATILEQNPNAGEMVSHVATQLVSETIQQARDSIALNPILSNIIADKRLRDDMLDQFLETLETIIPYDSASIALRHDRTLEFVAVRGLLEEIPISDLRFEPKLIDLKHADILIEADHARVQIVHDVKNNPHWVPIEGTEYIRSWMGVLLYSGDELVGLLNLEHTQPQYFTETHAQLALALARQATMAIIYTRLHQQIQLDIQERELLQEVLVSNLTNIETMYAAQQLLASSYNLGKVLPEILNILASSLKDAAILLVVFDATEGQLLHCFQLPETHEDIWSIFRTVINQPRLPKNTMPAAELAQQQVTRILSDRRQVLAAVVNRRGMLIAMRAADDEPFSEIEQELVVTIAHQITVAVENELLDAQVQHYTEQLERLVSKRTQQLSVEQKRLQAILDATAEGIFYMENFLLQYTNPAFCRMVGYSFEELYGKPLSFVCMISQEDEPHNFSVLLGNPLQVEVGRSETRLRHRDGREFYASIRYSLIGQPNENPIRMVAIARDISQERKLYFQRARFISNAAHELRTPLSSLVLRLHMLRRQPEKLSQHLDSLDSITVYLRQLVEQLLDLSRFERGTIDLDRKDLILQNLAQQAASEHAPFAKEEGVRLELVMPDTPIEINGDGTRLVQMMSNLVANGINYNHEKGSVTLKLQVEQDTVGNRNAIIEVIDDGIGIEPELLPDEIFEPFVRPSGGTRRETGMGLALVREIAVLHGGSVHVRSQLDEGSIFHVSLPIN